MEIETICKNQERKELIENCARFYAKTLNLKNSRYNLVIRSTYNLRKNKNSNGEVYQSGNRSIFMALDSRLSLSQLLLTLAHEMVHVKQIAKGQYKGRLARNGRLLACWLGKAVRTEYLKRPWEIEAFGRQADLVETLVKYVAKKKKSKGWQ